MLPTLGILAKTKKSLAQLIQITLEILTAAIGCIYTDREIMAKIDFVKTESTSHNLGVTEMVCEKVESEYVPRLLVCNIHPLIMMQLKSNNCFKSSMAKLETIKLINVLTLMLI